jgi:hypothetical protein
VKYVELEEERRLGQMLTPGVHETSEASYIQSLEGIDRTVANWCRHVRDELRATLPVYEELDEIRGIIEEHINKNVDNPEEPFSASEVEELRQKLDFMAEQFSDLLERNEITEKELNVLNREVTALKENMKGFTKGAWYRTAGTRLFDVARKIVTSKEGRKVLADAARKALGVDN